MPSITLKDIPEDLHAQLRQEAEAHFRSVDQEVLARIQRSFDLDDHLSAERVNRLIAEAMTSGPEGILSREKFDAARDQARRKFAERSRAA
jgi:plasmid stability protein